MTTKSIFHNILIENEFITPSYEHYGGFTGFQDYGILGSKIKRKIIELWREHFLSNDNIEEIEAPTILPQSVLKASGHITKFNDLVININGEERRADHVAKQLLLNGGEDVAQVDGWNKLQIETYLNLNKDKLNVKDNIEVCEKNLMLEVGNEKKMYLRPELAQNIFVNFKQYYNFAKGKLPFGIAQIGTSYRNEISPKPFTRMRAFTQFEIEYFFNPQHATHANYKNIKHLTLPLVSIDSQLNNNSHIECQSVENAFNNKIIQNEILAYFLAKIYEFAIIIGLDLKKIRFRQHLPTEKAHYSSDCWDLECFVDEEWLECIGVANRQDYDLKSHSVTNSLQVKSDEMENKLVVIANNGLINKTYKKDAKKLLTYLNNLDQTMMEELENNINTSVSYIVSIDDVNYELNKQLVQIRTDEINKTYYPHVIEPSFGFDRLLYTVLEHNFWTRPDKETRYVLSLNPKISPYDIAVLQLSNKPDLLESVNTIVNILKSKYKIYTDTSGTAIGKKYVRTDVIGINYAITVDFQSMIDQLVTVRERDSMVQQRIPINDLLHYFIKKI